MSKTSPLIDNNNRAVATTPPQLALIEAIQRQNVLVEKVIRYGNYAQYGIKEASDYNSILKITS